MALDPRVAAWTEPEGERATLAEYLRRYRLTLEMKRADLDAAQLACRSVPPSTMRSVLAHMMEEHARHCGHADLLRERVDGRIGQ